MTQCNSIRILISFLASTRSAGITSISRVMSDFAIAGSSLLTTVTTARLLEPDGRGELAVVIGMISLAFLVGNGGLAFGNTFYAATGEIASPDLLGNAIVGGIALRAVTGVITVHSLQNSKAYGRRTFPVARCPACFPARVARRVVSEFQDKRSSAIVREQCAHVGRENSDYPRCLSSFYSFPGSAVDSIAQRDSPPPEPGVYAPFRVARPTESKRTSPWKGTGLGLPAMMVSNT